MQKMQIFWGVSQLYSSNSGRWGAFSTDIEFKWLLNLKKYVHTIQLRGSREKQNAGEQILYMYYWIYFSREFCQNKTILSLVTA